MNKGQRVRLVKTAPFCASEKAMQHLRETFGLEWINQMQNDFEAQLKQAHVQIGSEGTAGDSFVDGFTEVVFDNTSFSMDIPLQLLEPA